MRLRVAAVLLVSVGLMVALPLLGVVAAGWPVAAYLEFPPRTEHMSHAPFTWSASLILALPVLAAAALYGAALTRARPEPDLLAVRRRFPWWGWLGLALIAAGWFLAWSRGLVPPEWHRHTFTPLWVGYVLVINGLIFRQAGRSPLTDRTALFLLLFPVSAAFWWLFEYLNQFVDNWYYTGIEALDDWDYFLQATLPFSTVLPAVLSTWVWLQCFPRFNAMRLPALHGPAWLAWLAVGAGTLGLAGIGLWPEGFYPMLWLAPLFLLLGLQQLVLGETLLAPLKHGDWRPLLQPALAALVCGFFWEMWNSGSLAQWHYSIPYADRFHLFEMPLLGYAGYLPFGIECAVIIDLVARLQERRPLWPLDVKDAHAFR